MKKIFFGITVFLFLFLTGCGVNELENSAFPLAVGVAAGEEDAFEVYMAYPNLQDSNALENALSSDVYWQDSVGNLFVGADKISENSSKNVDFNHLKALILDKTVLETPQKREQVVAFFQEKKDVAWNTYVFLADGDLDYLFSEELDIQSSLGIYLEDLVEEWTNIRSTGFTTVGDLMSQYYNENKTALIPVVTVKDKKPVVQSFEAVKNLVCISGLTQDQAYEAMLLQNQLKSFSFSLEDDTRVTLQLIRTERGINQEEEIFLTDNLKTAVPVVNVTVHATAKIENRLSLSESEQRKLCEQAQQELAVRLLMLADRQKMQDGYDPVNSFYLLAGHNRSLWQQYRFDQDAYEEALQYRIEVKLANRET